MSWGKKQLKKGVKWLDDKLNLDLKSVFGSDDCDNIPTHTSTIVSGVETVSQQLNTMTASQVSLAQPISSPTPEETAGHEYKIKSGISTVKQTLDILGPDIVSYEASIASAIRAEISATTHVISSAAEIISTDISYATTQPTLTNELIAQISTIISSETTSETTTTDTLQTTSTIETIALEYVAVPQQDNQHNHEL